MPFDTSGNETEEQPGPEGSRMMQLGILTKNQKKKPVQNPAEQQGLAATLMEKAQERKQSAMQQGPANTVPNADPMKTSTVPRTPMMKGKKNAY
jgi:hypothetical protein